jgi:neopullulanase
MRVVLDGVFNHASRGFWPFHHLLENGADSPYVDWFSVKDWPLRPYHSTPEHPPNYESWWGLPALPKLNTKHPDVQDYIFDVARYWIDFGIDGWRLDVPGEIDDESFWQRFRAVVKQANPEAYICGEIWEEAQRWLRGDQFDSVMNYIFSWAVMSYVGGRTLRHGYKRDHLSLEPRDAYGFQEVIEYMHGLYDWEVNHVQLNLLDSHDTARALWIMGEDTSALKLAVLLQMTMPGAPCVYYGDEIGMSAGDDPFCRAAFPWDHEALWDHELLTHYRATTALRHRFAALRTGAYISLYASKEVFGFRRVLGEEEIVVVINAGQAETHVELPVNGVGNHAYRVVWPLEQGPLLRPHGIHLHLNIPPRAARVVAAE